MLPFLLCSILSATATSTNGNPASVTIYITATIVPAHTLSMNIEPIDSTVAGLQKLTINEIEGGISVSQEFLIIDYDLDTMKDPIVVMANLDGNYYTSETKNQYKIGFKVPITVTVIEYPSDLTKNQIIALFAPYQPSSIMASAKTKKRK